MSFVLFLFLSDGKPGDSPKMIAAKVQKLRDQMLGRLHLHTIVLQGTSLKQSLYSLKAVFILS